MHILVTLTYYRPHYSGLTIYAERVAKALVNRGHRLTVLTSRYDKSLAPHEIQNGIEIIRPDVWFRISKGVIMPSMPYWSWKEIRKADILHLHVPQFDAAPISVLGKLLSTPIVLTYHCDLQLPSGYVHNIANCVSNLANSTTAKMADKIVTNTLDYAENSVFLQSKMDKVVSILPPIDMVEAREDDLQRFRNKFNIKEDERLIGMAARLASEKGVEYLANALQTVLNRYPEARVLFVGPFENVVGEESYAEKLAPLIDSLGKHWSFLGILSPTDMTSFFKECEVTILPSINSTESYGMVQVESMNCATPVVSTDLPGVRVPVQMSEMGIIVAPNNSAALSEAIIEILDKPDKYQGNPKKILEYSTPDYVAGRYEDIFNSLR